MQSLKSLHLLSCSSDGSIHSWDVDSGLISTLQYRGPGLATAHGDSLFSLAITPDGRNAVSISTGISGRDNALRMWDISTGECIKSVKCRTPGNSAVGIVSGHRAVVGGFGPYVSVWDLNTCEHSATLPWPSYSIGLSARPDLFATIGEGHDKRIMIWDSVDFKLKTEINDVGNINSIFLSEDTSYVASGGYDGCVNVFDVETGHRKQSMRDGHVHDERGSGQVFCVRSVLERQLLVSGSRDGSVCLWDLASGRCETKLQGHKDYVYSVATMVGVVASGGGSSDPTIRVWDLTAGKCRYVMQGHKAAVMGLAALPAVVDTA